MDKKKKIIIAVTGASGSIYAKRILEKSEIYKNSEISLILSETAEKVWEYELKNKDFENTPCKLYKNNDLFAAPASGSAGFDIMIIIPCSMGTTGRIANGVSYDLITRSADVMLKERKKLIIVPREAPLSLIHIENYKKLTLAGAILCPASPSFYSFPKSIDDLVDTVINRVLRLADIDTGSFKWG